MKQKKVVVSQDLTPDWPKWLEKQGNIQAEIWRQLILGLKNPGSGLTLDQLQLVVEHRNPFEKKGVTATEDIRNSQIVNLQSRGYVVNAVDVPFPDEAKLKLGPALLVDYETPIDKQCQLLGIKNYLNFSYHKDLLQKPQGRWGWVYGVENGKTMLGKSPDSCIKEFGRNNRRGLMTVEGFALYRENPDLLKDHYVDLSGSRYVKFGGRVPSLYLSGGVPSLDDFWAGCGSSPWGSASAVVV